MDAPISITPALIGLEGVLVVRPFFESTAGLLSTSLAPGQDRASGLSRKPDQTAPRWSRRHFAAELLLKAQIDDDLLGKTARPRSQHRRRLWPAVLLSTDRPPDLLAVLARDRGGRVQANADSTTLVNEGALCGDPPDDVLRCQYRRHRHHLAWTLFGVLGLLLTR